MIFLRVGEKRGSSSIKAALQIQYLYHFMEHPRKVSRHIIRTATHKTTSEAPAVEQAQLNPCINYGGLGGRHCETQSLVEDTNMIACGIS